MLKLRLFYGPFYGIVLTILCSLASVSVALAAEQPIRVGITISLSGDYAELGQDELDGVLMWVDDINRRAGLLGRKVVIVYYDDKSSPKESAKLYQRLIVKDKVDLLLGPYGSDITYAASEVAAANNFPMVATGAASSRIWNRGLKGIYQIDAPANGYMDLSLALAKDKGAKRVALVYANSEFPRAVAKGAKASAEKYGMELVFMQMYPNEDVDFNRIVQQMRTAKPDVVIGGTYFDDSVALVRALCKADMKPKMVALTVGPALHEFGEKLGSNANGIMGAVAWMRGAKIPLAYDFAYRYKERYGRNPPAAAAYGYGGGQVLEAGVRLAGSLDKAAISEHLGTMTFRSVLGHYHVGGTGKQAAKKAYTMQWQDGHRRLVLPARIAESTAVYPLKACSER
jgi:branched-chain amino acid transport system substrate-binding protein